jgi:hypothetical protein
VPAIVLASTWDLALAQGYAPRAVAPSRRRIDVAGIEEPVDVVLLSRDLQAA